VELSLRQFFESPTTKALAQHVAITMRSSEGPAPRLQRVAREGTLPLSYAQQRLWFLDQLKPGSSFYNLPGAVLLRGSLKQSALEDSLKELVRRHEILRTTFGVADGQPFQVIAPTLSLPLPVIDLSNLAP